MFLPNSQKSSGVTSARCCGMRVTSISSGRSQRRYYSDARRFGLFADRRALAEALERNLAFLWDTHLSDRDAIA